MVFNALVPFPYPRASITNVAPVTYRDAETFLEQLETIKKWLNDYVITGVNESHAALIDVVAEGIANAEATVAAAKAEWVAEFDAYMADVTESLLALNDPAVTALLNNPASALGTAVRVLLGELETETQTALSTKIPATEKGVASGVATLTAGGIIPVGQVPAPSFSGNYGTRPAANTVVIGATFHALDTKESYRSNGVNWSLVGKGGYSGSASLVTNYNTASLDLVDVPGLAVTFVAGSGIAKISLSGEGYQTVNGGRLIGVIEVNGEAVGNFNVVFAAPNVPQTFNRVTLMTTLIAGQVYTAKVKVMTHYTTGGFANLDATPPNPVTLLVESI